MSRKTELLEEGLTTVMEAASFLGLSRSLLYQLMDRGELAYVEIGRARRIPRRALVELASNNLFWSGKAGGSQ